MDMGFTGYVIRLTGGQCASVCLPGETHIHLAPHTQFDTDPMVQARQDDAAWADVGVMVSAMPFGAQHLRLARTLWAMGLETLPPGLRRLANLADFCGCPKDTFRTLGGWFAKTDLVPDDERWRVGALLDAWRADPARMATLLHETRVLFRAAGCPARPYGEPPVRLGAVLRFNTAHAIIFETGGRDAGAGHVTRLKAQLAALLADLTDPARARLRRPCLIVIDEDCDPGFAIMATGQRRALAARGVTLLVQTRTLAKARELFGIAQGDTLAKEVSTLVVATSDRDNGLAIGLSPEVLDHAKPNELIAGTAKHKPMRLDAWNGAAMRDAIPAGARPFDGLLWSKPALVFSPGPELPTTPLVPPPLPAPLPAPELATDPGPAQVAKVEVLEPEAGPDAPEKRSAIRPGRAVQSRLRRVLSRRL
jgi:hypothetical protein